ncbi:MAG: rhodanese-like domain-containing protein [Gaiellaceae bacterium]
MNRSLSSASLAIRIGWLLLVALAFGLPIACAKPVRTLTTSDTIQPGELAKVLADSSAAHPMLIHVGFDPLYRSGHIPGSAYAGAGSKPGGLASLKDILKTVPASEPIVLYCGCCPWTDCPNVRPAFQTALASGHSNVHVLFIQKTLEHDWTEPGYPTAKGAD